MLPKDGGGGLSSCQRRCPELHVSLNQSEVSQGSERHLIFNPKDCSRDASFARLSNIPEQKYNEDSEEMWLEHNTKRVTRHLQHVDT